jgi:hypothetical protein
MTTAAESEVLTRVGPGKIGAADGKSFVQLTASTTGMTPESYTAMMVRGGREPGAPVAMTRTINRAKGGK